MVKATIYLNIMCERGDQILSFWGDPVENATFKAFGVIASCPRCVFGKLIIGIIYETMVSML